MASLVRQPTLQDFLVCAGDFSCGSDTARQKPLELPLPRKSLALAQAKNGNGTPDDFTAPSWVSAPSPVRAWMCRRPADSPWSSHGCSAFGHDGLLMHSSNPDYQRLGNARAAFRAIILEMLSDEPIQAVQLHRQPQQCACDRPLLYRHRRPAGRAAGPLKIGASRKVPNRLNKCTLTPFLPEVTLCCNCQRQWTLHPGTGQTVCRKALPSTQCVR